LATSEIAYNNSRQASTQETPFYVDTGQHFRLPHALLHAASSNVPAAEDFVSHLALVTQQVQAALSQAQGWQAQYADQHRKHREFQEGDYVLVQASNITLPWQRRQQSRKLQPQFLGPFEILKKQSPLVYQLKLPPSLQLHPAFHISQLEHYTGDVESLGSQPPPELVHTGDTVQEEWEVETIMD